MNDNPVKTGFVDTNIWLYAFIESGQTEKSRRARDLIQSCIPIVSIQVINEVCVNLIKKANFSEEQICQLIGAFYEKYHVVELDLALLLAASTLRQHNQLSFWDSIIVASALQAQVNVLYTEDLQHKQMFEGRLQIVNPFAV